MKISGVIKRNLLLRCALVFFTFSLSAEERFPSPEFQDGYVIPTQSFSEARLEFLQWVDSSLLILVMLLAVFFAIRRRSRVGLFITAFVSLVYFGFYRMGCICPIGAIQNVTLSFFDHSYLIPVPVIIFFIAPLFFALFFGRVFCSGVCPLGAIQEMVIYKPVTIPWWINGVLSIVPFVYLGLSILFAATGSFFIVCRFDPFIGFFRLTGPFLTIFLGAAFLITGMFIARPYCRFFCPYGVLLGICSIFSKKHLSITPDDCIQCKLCEKSCPVDAINKPAPSKYKLSIDRIIHRVLIYALLFPLLVLSLGFGFSRFAPFFADQNRTVWLANRIFEEEGNPGLLMNEDTRAFREKGMSTEKLYKEAKEIRRNFYIGFWILGVYLGFVIFIKMAFLLKRKKSTIYEPDRFKCVSCGRCLDYCPVTAKETEDNRLKTKDRIT